MFDTVARDRARMTEALARLVASLGTRVHGLIVRDIILEGGYDSLPRSRVLVCLGFPQMIWHGQRGRKMESEG